MRRDHVPEVIAVDDLPDHAFDALTSKRPAIAGMGMGVPRIMGILNTTPDSFSDGGKHTTTDDAVSAGCEMVTEGADILDIGGESTRPGALAVAVEEEIRRTAPVIAGLRTAGVTVPISIDTRKAAVAEAALDAGATLVNDVAGFTYDNALAPLCANRSVPVCVMHALGDPATMQQDPKYDNVALDVFDFLQKRIAALEAVGVARSSIIADPGIGFGKTQTHNLALLARLSLFHSLGVPILLGASRKRFIGTIGRADVASDRAPGSIGVALAALAHGVQVLRVHDVAQTRQAIALWRAAMTGISA
ncbi:MAG: dihydropteroate synthase [Sulfitobacter sp.]